MLSDYEFQQGLELGRDYTFLNKFYLNPKAYCPEDVGREPFQGSPPLIDRLNQDIFNVQIDNFEDIYVHIEFNDPYDAWWIHPLQLAEGFQNVILSKFINWYINGWVTRGANPNTKKPDKVILKAIRECLIKK